MQRPISWLVALFALAVGTSVTFADDKDKTPAEAKKPAEVKSEAELIKEEMSELAKLDGVVKKNKGKNGQLLSCLIVGRSRISTVLGKAKGIETARQRAGLQASGKFVEYLKQNVTFYEGRDDEDIELIVGTIGEDEQTRSTSGKAIEKTSARYTSAAQDCVRGLVTVYTEIDAESESLVVIKGWKASTSEAVKKVRKDQQSDEPRESNPKKSKEAKPTNPDKAVGEDKSGEEKIKSSKAISDGAAEFFSRKKK